jgi:hypothetical protein
VRYSVSFLVGGIAFGALLTEPWWGITRFLIAPSWVNTVMHLAPLGLVALAIGFVAAPRGALISFAAYVLGVALWIVLLIRPGLPGTSDVWGYAQWGYFILELLPSAIASAIIGGIASLARSRLHSSSRPQVASAMSAER